MQILFSKHVFIFCSTFISTVSRCYFQKHLWYCLLLLFLFFFPWRIPQRWRYLWSCPAFTMFWIYYLIQTSGSILHIEMFLNDSLQQLQFTNIFYSSCFVSGMFPRVLFWGVGWVVYLFSVRLLVPLKQEIPIMEIKRRLKQWLYFACS